MQRKALYSRSDPPRAGAVASSAAQAEPTADPRPAVPTRKGSRPWLRRGLWTLGAFLVAVLGLFGPHFIATHWPHTLSQHDFDLAVRRSLEKQALPSETAKAYEAVYQSVVRVTGLMNADDDGRPVANDALIRPRRGVGSGVVIVDKGLILTNLHVVAGARNVRVRFFDGSESAATLVGVQPEHDLAVLQAQSIPDDLPAATLRSTADLAPGDRVIAVGFPFGIGPSVSAGVVSGLHREFRSPEGKQQLDDLIQFDAAANPGNSGGPLVTMDGAVVGIVTAILNPTEQHVFIGIGFAVPIEAAANAVGMPPF